MADILTYHSMSVSGQPKPSQNPPETKRVNNLNKKTTLEFFKMKSMK
jgi:hypothetical protein